MAKRTGGKVVGDNHRRMRERCEGLGWSGGEGLKIGGILGKGRMGWRCVGHIMDGHVGSATAY